MEISFHIIKIVEKDISLLSINQMDVLEEQLMLGV